jgi:serine/threonine protein kinase HipA of HipAB toxin-antitoxin module
LNGLPADLQEWQDDEALAAMLVLGDDLPGDLIVGTRALGVALQSPRREVVAAADRSRRYPEMADLAMQGGAVGSSAGGEQPKFTAAVREAGGSRAVLVKFSPPMDSPSGRRWSDLLAAEWLALRVLAEHGHESASAELLEGGGRRFLEVTRFDRVGDTGRRGVLTFQAIEAGLIDEPAGDWPAVASAMESSGLLAASDARALCRRWCFGQLIANTDMHLANASVWFGDTEPLALAPAYDMLPMLFRPGAGGEIVPRQFNPTPPPAHLQEEWDEVRPWAEEFWRRVAAEERISPEFREIARRAEDAVRNLS